MSNLALERKKDIMLNEMIPSRELEMLLSRYNRLIVNISGLVVTY